MSAVTSAIVAPRAPSKGPPPLPPAARTAAPASDEFEELFFLEGIDGHAESLPSSEPGTRSLTAGTRSLPEAPAEWLEEDLAGEEVEDPARTRRRRIARVGVAWGAVAMLALAGVAVWFGPLARMHEGAVATATSAPAIETPASALVVSAPATLAPLPAAHASTDSVLASTVGATARKSPPSTPAKHGAAKSTKVAGGRPTRAHTAPAAKTTAPAHASTAHAAPKAATAPKGATANGKTK